LGQVCLKWDKVLVVDVKVVFFGKTCE